jgi:hypothetical protein
MLWEYIRDVPVTKPVIGAGDVERWIVPDPLLLAKAGRCTICIMRGELLSGEEVSDSIT